MGGGETTSSLEVSEWQSLGVQLINKRYSPVLGEGSGMWSIFFRKIPQALLLILDIRKPIK